MTVSGGMIGPGEAAEPDMAAGMEVTSLLKASRSRVVALCVAMLVIATVAAGLMALRVYERVLEPELLQTARIAASTTSRAVSVARTLTPASFANHQRP